MGWAQGPDGKPTTDAELALKTSALMPLGGAEITSGFKGYALALMVETFCGMLGGEFFFVSYIAEIKRRILCRLYRVCFQTQVSILHTKHSLPWFCEVSFSVYT